MNHFLVLFISVLLFGHSNSNNEEHPCSDQISIETRVIAPNCSGKDGQIIFSNPAPSTASFKWSHDNSETGHNVGNLDAGTYSVTVTVASHVRVTRIILE